MFFTLNQERKIGFKKLTLADMGLSPTSHQTHIALYGQKNMLSFLGNEDTTNAILMYDGYCDILSCDFDRIKNPDGSFRSPKIRLGETKEHTVVRKIREFAAQNPSRTYYLVWFGLDNDELLFWLLDDLSSDYARLRTFFPTEDTVYDETHPNFSAVIRFVESKVDEWSLCLQKDLEVVGQMVSVSDRYKTIDIEKAQERFKETGRTGESLINNHLEKQKKDSVIQSFEWVNKSRESGKPFDFIVHLNGADEIYIDVKTTQFSFGQPLIFSDGEISFVKNISDEKYFIFRVHSLRDKVRKFRKCGQCFKYMSVLNSKIAHFKKDIQSVSSDVRGIKIAVSPSDAVFKLISDDIIL